MHGRVNDHDHWFNLTHLKGTASYWRTLNADGARLMEGKGRMLITYLQVGASKITDDFDLASAAKNDPTFSINSVSKVEAIAVSHYFA
jgi:hypothetical protein